MAQNAIVTENLLSGNPSSEWDISDKTAGDPSIQGFADGLSVNKGETVRFKINVTDAAEYNVKIYRLGYYGGDGARLIIDLGNFTGVIQPAPVLIDSLGLTDCGNWSESASWAVPSSAVSGVYIAKLTRIINGGSSHIVFIVRDDGGGADILFKTSDGTWQAYNVYGGNSLYTGTTGFTSGHATKVSYNRPFVTRNGGGGGGAQEDWLFNAEYPMIRWLERNGYNISYTTDLDMERDPTGITPSGAGGTYTHKVLLSVGHDEYWSASERAKWEAARDAGVHLAFFSGNEVYWKTRWEPSIDGTNTPVRTLVCYKEGTLGENVCGGNCDPTETWTGLWRDGCGSQYNPSYAVDGCNPENALTGQISWVDNTSAITVPYAYKDYRIWRNISAISTLTAGQTATLGSETLGYEWDGESPAYAANYPNGRILMSETNAGGRTHKLSLYKHSSGALVFGAGTCQWSWGLDANHDRGNANAEDIKMQQATLNLFADMGIQPGSKQTELIAALASTDVTSPVSIISSPEDGITIQANATITISGSASDANVVAGVEVSVDNGLTWHLAIGTTSWSYAWTPLTDGSYTIKSRGYDDSGNMEIPVTAGSNVISITVSGAATINCPCSIFPATTIPTTPVQNDQQPIILGAKFRSTVNGYITGIRFYKDALNIGTHIGQLWNSSGNLLASATFINETESGWQQVNFGTPVAIAAGTTYLASYQSLAGNYTASDLLNDPDNAFSETITNGPLQALADGLDGPNGMYEYSTNPVFPSQFYQKSNYWVDVVFETEVGPDNTPPSILSVIPGNGATGVNIGISVTGTFSEQIDASTVNTSSVFLQDESSNLVPAAVVYNEATQSVILTPSSPFAYSTIYTATIKGGTGYDRIKDLAGNAMVSDYIWSFTTAPPPTAPQPDGPGGPILVISAASNPFSRYPVEILRAEGFNEFFAMDVSEVTPTILNNYDLIILGEFPLQAAMVSDLSTWVNNGGVLIALRPDSQLETLLGITASGGTLSDKYILVNNSGPGVGIVDETIQFHGEADYYTLNGASSLAMLYSDATSATNYPAVTENIVGLNGGKAYAFTYDLARSVVYTRQGNPDWAGQERDGQTDNIRSSDMFYPDWIDFNKVAIPQADEQQHLLSNIITLSNLHKRPFPRFWFLPRKLKAAIVMTGDDHSNGGTVARFNQYLGYGNNTAQDILDWTAIRGTSYIYTSTPITDAQAAAFDAQGFEIALHVSTGCTTYTQASLEADFNSQLPAFLAKYSSIPSPVTHRTHCISWSDWASKPKVELANGIRLNTDYYYWPAAWIQNRPGMFTGSGMPMRFADLDGTIIDNYQVTTQMPDEAGITFPGFINTLLDNAIGTPGYYGVFCANMHTDANTSPGSDAIIASAQARNIPVISAKQMLTWLDARNGSSFGSITWSNNTLSFSVSASADAYKLQGMIPVTSSVGQLTGLSYNDTPISYTTEVIKGINYAFFDALTGDYEATYLVDNTGPVITDVSAIPGTNSALISWTTDEAADSRVDYGISEGSLSLNESNAALETSHAITLTGLTPGIMYYYRVTSTDAANNSTSEPVSPATLSFTMPTGPCASDATIADFNLGTVDANTLVVQEGDGAVILNPTLNEEFEGTTVPTGWSSGDFNPGGTTVGGGQVTVNGTHLYSNSSFPPGSSIEFEAIYNSGVFQNVGFSLDQAFNDPPWVTIGQGFAADGNLYARASFDNTQISLGSGLLGSPHLFKIKWNATNFEFYVDNSPTPNATINFPVTNNLYIQISDVQNFDGALSVKWIRVSPYASSGSFTSQIFDAGEIKTWNDVNWNAQLPTGTSLNINLRTGNTANPDGTWTSFSSVSNGGTYGIPGQYIQYRADLSTNDVAFSPVFNDISVSCSGVLLSAPVVSTHPASQTICEDSEVTFQSHAVGVPAPSVQWQESENGVDWDDITSANNPLLNFIVAIENDGKQYRAVWTNSEGSAETDAATLTVNALPDATINASSTTICPGGSIDLQLESASGTSPYTLIVNGNTYNDITVGQTFASFNSEELSIWGNTGSPAYESVNDNSAIEIGTKVRSSVDGYITGVRFYKGLTNTATHVAHVWSSSGTLLADETFTSETASGWQEVRFSSPVAIFSNTTYIVSYFSPYPGNFAITGGGLSSGFTNGPLTALAAGVDGPNGVYKYGGGFPDGGNNANYWVDVLFSETNPNENPSWELTSITDDNGCTNTGNPLSSVTVTLEPLPSGILTPSVATVCEHDNYYLIFNASGGTGPFSLTINGTTYPDIISGTPFAAGSASYSPLSASIWDNGTISGTESIADFDPVELGMRFRSIVAGSINSIKFYKGHTDNATYTVHLWTNAGTQLGEATITTSTSGWQEVQFSSPIEIIANTTYVASYYSPIGKYAAINSYFGSGGVISGPLKALQDGEDGLNGVYLYGEGGGFPVSSFQSSNYWVDVVFNSATSLSTFNLTEISSATGCMSTGTPINTTTINVNQLPSVDWTNTLNNQCSNSTSYQLTGGSPEGGSYSGSGVSGDIFNASIAGPGSHVLTYTYIDPITLCSNTTNNEITVYANPIATATSNSPVDAGLPLNLFSDPDGMASYLWNGPGGYSSTEANPVRDPAQVSYSGTYSVTVIDYNGCSASNSTDVIINEIINAVISGSFNYYNAANSILEGVEIELKQSGAVIDFTTTDENGYYEFTDVEPGTYEIVSSYSSIPGSINSTDAAQVNYWSVNAGEIELVRFYAGDVVNDLSILSGDASRIQQYFLTFGNPPFSSSWMFWPMNEMISSNPAAGGLPTVSVQPGETAVQLDFYGLITGDFNRSYTPGSKETTSKTLMLNYGNIIEVGINEIFDLSFYAGKEMEVGATSLILSFPSEFLDVNNVYLGNNQNTSIPYFVSGDELRISWLSLTPLSVKEGEPLLTLSLTLTGSTGENEIYFSLVNDPLNELADGTYEVIDDAVLMVDIIKTTMVGFDEVTISDQIRFSNHPNPFSETTTIDYSIPEEGKVTIEIYDIVGNKTELMMDEIKSAGEYQLKVDATNMKPGIYFARLMFNNEKRSIIKSIKISVSHY